MWSTIMKWLLFNDRNWTVLSTTTRVTRITKIPVWWKSHYWRHRNGKWNCWLPRSPRVVVLSSAIRPVSKNWPRIRSLPVHVSSKKAFVSSSRLAGSFVVPMFTAIISKITAITRQYSSSCRYPPIARFDLIVGGYRWLFLIVVFVFQSELESFTEKLSEMVARPYLRTPRSIIAEMTSKVRRKRHEFMRAVSKGLIPPETPPALRRVRRRRFPALMGIDPVEDVKTPSLLLRSVFVFVSEFLFTVTLFDRIK